MGTIRHRNGKYFIDLILQGKRYRKFISKSRKLAEIALREYELRADRQQLGFLERKDITFQDFFKEYADFSKTNHRVGTQKRYLGVIKNFEKFISSNFPNMAFIKYLKVDHLEKYKIYRRTQTVPRNGMYDSEKACKRYSGNGAKSNTVNFELTALKSIFYYAMRMQYLEVNPVTGVKKLKVEDAQKRRFLTEDECRTLLGAVSSKYHPMFYMLINTGMRRSEIIHLEWSDIDQENRVIKIQHKPFWNPKSGEREIPINDGLLEVIKNIPRKGNFVFCSKRGKRLNLDKVRLHLIKSARLAGISNLTQVHSLRHSFCSQLLQKGVDLPAVQKLMGHSNIQTTMIYAHQTTEQLRNAVSKIVY